MSTTDLPITQRTTPRPLVGEPSRHARSHARRLGGARLATGSLALGLVLAGCGASGAPPALHIGAGGADRSSAAMGAPEMASDAMGGAGLRPNTSYTAYTLDGTLPTDPSAASTYVFTGNEASDQDVSALATALGVTGTPVRHAHGWEVATSVGLIHVRDGGGHEWSFSRGSSSCPSYSIDIDSDGSGASSSCAIAVDGGVTPDGRDTGNVPVAETVGPIATAPTAVAGSTGSGSAGSTGLDTPVEPPPTAVPAPGEPTPVDPSTIDPTTVPAPEPGPSDSESLALASPVFTAIGLGSEKPRVLPENGPIRTVVVDPHVDGLPTSGVRTVIDIDHQGIMDGYGRLEVATLGAEYPIMTATAAFERLQAQPGVAMGRPEIGCVDTVGAPSPCDTPAPSVITGAELGLMFFYEADGPILVPAWLFAVRGNDEVMPMVAVADQYIADPTTAPNGTDLPFPVSPGSSGGFDPGFTGGSVDPVPPVTAPGGPGTGSGGSSIAITKASLGKDGSTLIVTGFGGVCATYAGYAKESDTEIWVVVEGTPTSAAGQGCVEIAKEITVSVTLAAPWNKRIVHDGTTGQQIPIS